MGGKGYRYYIVQKIAGPLYPCWFVRDSTDSSSAMARPDVVSSFFWQPWELRDRFHREQDQLARWQTEQEHQRTQKSDDAGVKHCSISVCSF